MPRLKPRADSKIRQINLRIPEKMRRRLASEAAKNDRSMNAEITDRIASSFLRQDIRDNVREAVNEAINGREKFYWSEP